MHLRVISGVALLLAGSASWAGGSDEVASVSCGVQAAIEVGMTPADAIKTATINAANALGLSDEIGSIEVGKSADLIVMDKDKDPLRNITLLENTRNILSVVKSGNIVAEKGVIVLD